MLEVLDRTGRLPSAGGGGESDLHPRRLRRLVGLLPAQPVPRSRRSAHLRAHPHRPGSRGSGAGLLAPPLPRPLRLGLRLGRGQAAAEASREPRGIEPSLGGRAPPLAYGSLRALGNPPSSRVDDCLGLAVSVGARGNQRDSPASSSGPVSSRTWSITAPGGVPFAQGRGWAPSHSERPRRPWPRSAFQRAAGVIRVRPENPAGLQGGESNPRPGAKGTPPGEGSAYARCSRKRSATAAWRAAPVAMAVSLRCMRLEWIG